MNTQEAVNALREAGISAIPQLPGDDGTEYVAIKTEEVMKIIPFLTREKGPSTMALRFVVDEDAQYRWTFHRDWMCAEAPLRIPMGNDEYEYEPGSWEMIVESLADNEFGRFMSEKTGLPVGNALIVRRVAGDLEDESEISDLSAYQPEICSCLRSSWT